MKNRLEEIRKDRGIRQEELALALGVSPRTVEAWEAGKNVPSGAAQRLLYLLEQDHSLIDRLVTQ